MKESVFPRNMGSTSIVMEGKVEYMSKTANGWFVEVLFLLPPFSHSNRMQDLMTVTTEKTVLAVCLGPRHSMCGARTRSNHVTWRLVGNVESQVLPNLLNKNRHFNQIPGDLHAH